MRIEHKNNILKLAIEYGCKTAKDLGRFLKRRLLNFPENLFFPLD